MEKINTLRKWIDVLPKKGKITFSKEEINKEFPLLSDASIQKSISRLVKSNKIVVVWQGFYVVIPSEYGLQGVVPPIVYTDQLMRYLGQEYYIGLLNAAVLHGAAHQQPQEFTVITSNNNLRSTLKGGVKINYVTKKNIPILYTQQIVTKYGYIRISNPELTAMDLIMYEKRIGGINRAATLLDELAEVVDFNKVSNDFFDYYPVPIVQRLGYLLDNELGFVKLADVLLEKAQNAGLSFRNTFLKTGANNEQSSAHEKNTKWKIIINEEIEIDE